MTGFVSVLNGQYVRIGNAGAIPNGAMMPPTILKSTLAPYTDGAQTQGIEGTVTIEAQVDINGRIKVLRVLKGLGFGLDEVAASTVGEWTLSPATRNGIPVEVISQSDVQFALGNRRPVRSWIGISEPAVIHRMEQMRSRP